MSRHGLAVPQRHAGVGMAEVVQPDVAQARLGPRRPPEPVQRILVEGTGRGGEDPPASPLQPVQDMPGGRRQPDRSRTRLAVREEQPALAIVDPSQRQDLALAAAGQQQQADDRNPPVGFAARQNRPETADLRNRQETFAPLPPVAPDAPGRVAVLRPVAVDLRLPHDDRQDRSRPVRRRGRRVQRSEPALDVPPRYLGDPALPEPRQDLLPVIISVDLERAGFPVPPVTLEYFFRDRLERHPLHRRRPAADPGQNRLRPRAGFFLGDVLADDLPDAPAVALAVNKVSLPAGRQNPDAEPLEFVVADVVGGFARLKSVDPALVDHASSPEIVASGEKAGAAAVPADWFREKETRYINWLKHRRCAWKVSGRMPVSAMCASTICDIRSRTASALGESPPMFGKLPDHMRAKPPGDLPSDSVSTDEIADSSGADIPTRGVSPDVA